MVNRNRQVASNAAWIIGGKVVQSVLGVLITMLTARYLGPTDYGLVNYASSLVAFVTPIAQLGLNAILVNELINHPEREGETLGTAMVMSLISSLLCMLGLAAFTLLANPNEPVTLVVCILHSIILLAHAVEMVQFWFQAHLKSKYVSIATLLAYLVRSVYQIVLLINKSSIYWFAVTSALDLFLLDAIILYLFNKNGKLSFSMHAAKRMFSQSKHYIVSTMMVTIFANTDRIMIKMMLGDSQTGFYSAAVACAGLTSFVFSAIISSMRPVILDENDKNEVGFSKYLTVLYSVIIYLSLLQCIVIALFAPSIIRILYGEAYAPSVEPLRWIVWYTTFSYLGSIRNIWILAKKKHGILWKINLIGALGNVALNLTLIPIWGVTGAAVASLVTQIFTNVVLSIVFRELRSTIWIMKDALNTKNLYEGIVKVIRK